ncbi:MAG: DUF3499 family protein [Acidimicrobiales bacterium]
MATDIRCARPDCGLRGVALLAYDYAARAVWLDDLPGGRPLDRWLSPVCQAHADGLTVPLGWTCEDRRSALAAVAEGR